MNRKKAQLSLFSLVMLMTGIVESQGMKIARFCWMVAILLWGSLFDVYWRQREAALRARCP